jgi:hypothetical protein
MALLHALRFLILNLSSLPSFVMIFKPFEEKQLVLKHITSSISEGIISMLNSPFSGL